MDEQTGSFEADLEAGISALLIWAQGARLKEQPGEAKSITSTSDLPLKMQASPSTLQIAWHKPPALGMLASFQRQLC